MRCFQNEKIWNQLDHSRSKLTTKRKSVVNKLKIIEIASLSVHFPYNSDFSQSFFHCVTGFSVGYSRSGRFCCFFSHSQQNLRNFETTMSIAPIYRQKLPNEEWQCWAFICVIGFRRNSFIPTN